MRRDYFAHTRQPILHGSPSCRRVRWSRDTIRALDWYGFRLSPSLSLSLSAHIRPRILFLSLSHSHTPRTKRLHAAVQPNFAKFCTHTYTTLVRSVARILGLGLGPSPSLAPVRATTHNGHHYPKFVRERPPPLHGCLLLDGFDYDRDTRRHSYYS